MYSTKSEPYGKLWISNDKEMSKQMIVPNAWLQWERGCGEAVLVWGPEAYGNTPYFVLILLWT